MRPPSTCYIRIVFVLVVALTRALERNKLYVVLLSDRISSSISYSNSMSRVDAPSEHLAHRDSISYALACIFVLVYSEHLSHRNSMYLLHHDIDACHRVRFDIDACHRVRFKYKVIGS
ncbi:hypothetical protein T492DRAFT_986661 [Pavlovales sp. CCMP2436]|nr:hypothetical protein T492DRAFT_986661 [Pavlovales sp. CCMP2436]